MSAAYPLVRNVIALVTRCGVLTSPSRSGSSPRPTRSCRMRASIAVFYIAALATSAVLRAQAPDPDALYRERPTLAKAREAANIWGERLAKNPKDFESAWKLARATYWLGGHEDAAARRPALERGVEAGRRASMLEPTRPEGYFWMAASMGELAESFGLRQGLKYRTPIREALEK